jgi:diguanylate cyclase (GGDEF)-like protein
MSDEKKRNERGVVHVPEAPEDDPPSRPSLARASLLEWADEESSTRTTDATVPLPTPASARQATRALLTVVNGGGAGRVHPVRDDETIIGRGKECQMRIDDAGTSRRHARITQSRDGRHVVEDMGSTNGTFVNGRRIQRHELQSGERIHIGPNVIITFAILDSQAVRLTHQMYESSVRDPLTRAHNRRYLVERLASEIAYARRHGSRLALLLFDVDHFKRVNDTHGHLAGDEVLREVAALVSRMIRAEDVFARFGGEEFVVLVRGIEHANVARFAERLRMGVERLEIPAESVILRATISVGFVSIDQLGVDERTADGLMRLADERLYRAKTDGRNRTCGG